MDPSLPRRSLARQQRPHLARLSGRASHHCPRPPVTVLRAPAATRGLATVHVPLADGGWRDIASHGSDSARSAVGALPLEEPLLRCLAPTGPSDRGPSPRACARRAAPTEDPIFKGGAAGRRTWPKGQAMTGAAQPRNPTGRSGAGPSPPGAEGALSSGAPAAYRTCVEVRKVQSRIVADAALAQVEPGVADPAGADALDPEIRRHPLEME